MKIIADATDANAASGATAAPILAHPSANNCRAPPKIIPSDKCPVAKPINEQAIIGWWNWNWSKILSIPAKNATTRTKIIARILNSIVSS